MYFKSLFFLLLASLSLCFTSCLEDSCDETRTFIQMERRFITSQEMRVTPQLTETRAVENPGKIYFYNNYILLNENRDGIHVIDNTDPSNPDNIGFIEIPGNVDIAIRNNVMYADNYADLLVIDIENIESPQLISREESVFQSHFFNQTEGFFVEWIETETTLEVDCSDPRFNRSSFWQGENILFDAVAPTGAGGNTGGGANPTSTGSGGSLARFTITKNHLYVINNQFEIISYDINVASTPIRTDAVPVDWGIETLFPYKDHLFIGANAGMFIYDLSTPSRPTYVSEFQHARACDPVFVNDEVAYVTLRDGTLCENFTNQLDVIDVEDLFNPTLIKTYSMEHPHGLAVSDNNLFLCEGEHGLKVFDVADKNKIDDNLLAHFTNFAATDVISLNPSHLILIGVDGLYQFDTSDPTDIKQLSLISVQ